MTAPPLLDRPPLGLDDPLDEDLLGSFGGFPESLFMISLGDGKYAANNATLQDGTVLDGLAVFPTDQDAELYTLNKNGLNGEIVQKSFTDAREIAISKPKINSLLLFQNNRIVEYHWVR